jgi:hypothetical protein
MNTEILAQHNPLWRETLVKLRHDVYHLPEYVELEGRRSSTTPEAVVITEGDNIFFVPYLLRSCQDFLPGEQLEQQLFDIISPYGYPGILLNEVAAFHPDFANLALHQLTEVLNIKGICAAFFRLHPILGGRFQEIFTPSTFVENGETVSVDLTLSESEIWAHTRKGHQSTINKCKKLGQTARMVPFVDYIDEFINIYNETMNRVFAKESYYFGYDYFSNLLKLRDKLHLGIVELDDQVICASLFFECCGIVQAHLGGTRTEFLKYSPFNLLIHYVRLWAKKRGNDVLHLGGGIGGSKEDLLYRFKSGFSRKRHKFLTARLIINSEQYYNLVEQRAQLLAVSPEMLLNSDFFPAYRASVSR